MIVSSFPSRKGWGASVSTIFMFDLNFLFMV